MTSSRPPAFVAQFAADEWTVDETGEFAVPSRLRDKMAEVRKFGYKTSPPLVVPKATESSVTVGSSPPRGKSAVVVENEGDQWERFAVDIDDLDEDVVVGDNDLRVSPGKNCVSFYGQQAEVDTTHFLEDYWDEYKEQTGMTYEELSASDDDAVEDEKLSSTSSVASFHSASSQTRTSMSPDSNGSKTSPAARQRQRCTIV